jgi:hypothetical protein
MPQVALLIVTSAVFLSLTAAPTPKQDEAAKLYYPTRVGDKWTYLFTRTSDDARGVITPAEPKEWEFVEEVTAVEPKKGAKVVTVGRYEAGGKVYPNRVRQVSEEGVWQTEEMGKAFRNPWVHLKLPHKAGQSWENEEQIKDTTLTAHGPEKLKVPAGEFVAVRVEQRKSGKPDSDPIQTDWYAPRVGIVKLKTGNLLMVMKEFTPGKP